MKGLKKGRPPSPMTHEGPGLEITFSKREKSKTIYCHKDQGGWQRSTGSYLHSKFSNSAPITPRRAPKRPNHIASRPRDKSFDALVTQAPDRCHTERAQMLNRRPRHRAARAFCAA